MSETVHATAAFWRGIGILIRGRSGSGKSMLAARLIADGGILVADDRVFLSARSGRLIASPPAGIAGLLEMRGRGLITVPFERSTVIGLVVDIVDDSAFERMPETAQFRDTLLGVELPRQLVPGRIDSATLIIGNAIEAICGSGQIEPCTRAEDGQDASRL